MTRIIVVTLLLLVLIDVCCNTASAARASVTRGNKCGCKVYRDKITCVAKSADNRKVLRCLCDKAKIYTNPKFRESCRSWSSYSQPLTFL